MIGTVKFTSEPEIDPVAFSLGPLDVRWYGIMYLLGFLSGFMLLKMRAQRPQSGWTAEQVSDLIFYGAMGVILGGRIGYVLFYNFSGFLANPLSLFQVWNGGMSFHGGLLGVMFAVLLFALGAPLAAHTPSATRSSSPR